MAKTKKQDPKEVSKEPHEIAKIAAKVRKFNEKKITLKVIRDVKWYAGKSRSLIYEVLRHMGYVIPGKFDKRLKRKLKDVLFKMGIDG